MSCADVQTIQAGNGSKTQFSFDFPYLFKTEIEVSFWNATTKEWDVKATTDATYPWQVTDANPTIVEFTSTAPALPTTPTVPGEPTIDNVRIRRVTNIDDIRALFSPGSAIRSDDLNKNFEQLRYAIQEANCLGVPNELYQYLLDNYWDRFDNTIYSADTWRSDDATIATTAALDQRFQDEVNDTLTKAELAAASDVMPDDDVAVPTTGATKDYIDHVIETDILVDGTGLNKSGSGGQVTLGISAGSVDLDRIKPEDIITSAESNPNNDTTIATTAKIDDMIDAAITGDIASDGTGITVTDDGDGTITLGIAANSVDFDRIKNSDIITRAEQDAGTAEADTNIFTALAAAKRFDTLVQTSNPGLEGDWEVGKTWLQNDSNRALSIWNGTSWLTVSEGGGFVSQPNVVYVDKAAGDDAATGNRISTPKETIKAAIEQINSNIEIDVTAVGFNGGSGYVDGNYSNVSLTHSSGTGIGTGLQATITVSGGAVTAISLSAAQQTTLEEYSIGDVLTASNADLGGSGSGLLIPITGEGDGKIVVVAAGVYQEIAPIQIKRRNVSIIGQALRSCIVHPTQATETNNLFELNSGSYLSSMTFTGIKAGTGTGNTLDATLPTTQGWNAAFYSGAFITKSPYIQNCTNFSDSEIDNSDLRAHRPRGGAAGDTDSAPTGGGLLVNGATPATSSPLRSMVCDSYTHVALNGPGILVVNNGYAQCTSSYAFFNRYHIKCLNCGQANLAASTTDFGDQALVADGRSTTAIFTAALSTAASDQDITFTIDAPTADASWHGSETRPQSNMLVELNSITYPILSATANGGGWDVTISRPDPNNRSNNLGLNGAVATPATASFFLRSQIASSGHTMEYVGSGTNYNALPENGGVPDEADQIVELNNGKVWTAITDHNGKFKIGGNQTDDPIFEVDQQLGFVTIPEGSIAFNLLSDQTPQLGGNLDVNGNTITGLSNPTANDEVANKAYVDAVAGTPTQIAQLNTSVATSDTGTDGTITFTTDGTTAMTVDNNQRVGIGTTAPGSPLSVQGSDNSVIAHFHGTTGTNTRGLQIGLASNITANNLVDLNAVGTYGTLTFSSNSAERARIDSSGRLGLGTSTPGDKLEITGDSNDFGLLLNNPTANPARVTLTNNEGSGFIDQNNNLLRFNQSDSADVVIDSSGNVGIGTTSPNNLLSLAGSAPRLEITDTDTSGRFLIDCESSVGSVNLRVDQDNVVTSSAFVVSIDGSEKARIDSSGRLGLGTSAPSQKLHIVASSGVNNCIRAELSGTATYETAAGNFINTDTGTGSARGINVSGTDFGVFCSSGTNYFAGN